MQASRNFCSGPNHLAHRQRQAASAGWLSRRAKAAQVCSLPAPEELLLANLKVVLVAPKTEANIGAVARTCGNFEAPNLCIVAPRCNVQADEVAWVACGTYITDRLQVVGSLEEALSDCVGSVGFSRRSGSMRYVHACLGDLLGTYPDWIPGLAPAQSAEPAGASQSGTVALVFGREESGLTHEELRLVTHVCAIPSGRIQPSLNLSHAVAVVLSECFNRRAYSQLQQQASSSQQAGSLPQLALDVSPSSVLPGGDAQGEAAKAAGVTSRPFWLESTSQPGVDKQGSKTRNTQFAVLSEVEPLLKKVAFIAEACGLSPEDSTTGGVHSRKRLPMGHIRAILGRAKVTVSEVNSIHGFASLLIEMIHPGHPLGKRRKGEEQPEQ